jgi:hypothetical protein
MADMPGWLADEVETARAERADALERLGLQDTAATPGARDRINEAVDATIDGWMAKGGRSCSHLGQPVPAFLPFGNRRIMCSMCLDFYQAGITGTDDDRRCDLCGEKILTPTLAPLMVEVGPFTVMGGACRPCRGVDD